MDTKDIIELEKKNTKLYRRYKNIKRERNRLLKLLNTKDLEINKLQDEINNILKDNEWISL